MGCGCNKTKEFLYTDHKGSTSKHETLVAARAAQINDTRAGHPKGVIREQVKR